MKVMLLAGEASGDLHGAGLARALAELRPGIELFGLGGERMAAAGVRLLFDPTRVSLIGFGEALKRLPLFLSWRSQVKAALRRERPAAVVLIDFGGFNLGVAEYARRLGIPAVYYICPAAWAWGRGRARKVARSCTRVASVFPFEAEVYRQAGARVEFVGHPLLDVVHASGTREESRQGLGVGPGELLVGLLPGSRRQESEGLLPVMLAAGQLLARRDPGLRWALGLAPTVDRGWIEEAVGASGLPVRLTTATYDVMQAADVLLVASGTATLEAALFGTPMVMVYRISPFTYALAKRLVRLRHYGTRGGGRRPGGGSGRPPPCWGSRGRRDGRPLWS
jgi:lipid-A-disaccharide synthase